MISHFLLYVLLKIRENDAEVQWKYLSYPILMKVFIKYRF